MSDNRIPTISVCVLLNKEDEMKVRDFISSVIDFADEIIIADRSFNDRAYIINKFFNERKDKIKLYKYNSNSEGGIHFGKAKNFVMEKATKDFILNLDADEILSASFKKNIRKFLKEKNPKVVRIARVDEVLTRRVDWLDRIVKNNRDVFFGTDENFRINEELVHPYKAESFDFPVWHCQRETHFFQQFHQRLFIIEIKINQTPKTKSFMGHIMRGLWIFYFKFKKDYFERKLYRDGLLGLKYSFMRALHDSLVQLFVALKPKEGYKYWEDPKWKKKFEDYAKKFE